MGTHLETKKDNLNQIDLNSFKELSSNFRKETAVKHIQNSEHINF